MGRKSYLLITLYKHLDYGNVQLLGLLVYPIKTNYAFRSQAFVLCVKIVFFI